MSATFTRAVRYRVEAVCLTPLRTGGADGAVETVLRDWTGRPFVQGTSLAGALRDWLADRDPDKVESLFGSQQQSGSLMVSDGLFEVAAEQQTRPRLRIDGATGTADDGGKFDVAHIAAGTKLTFTLTWLGSEEMPEQTGAVEQMLAALHAGRSGWGRKRPTALAGCPSPCRSGATAWRMRGTARPGWRTGRTERRSPCPN